MLLHLFHFTQVTIPRNHLLTFIISIYRIEPCSYGRTYTHKNLIPGGSWVQTPIHGAQKIFFLGNLTSFFFFFIHLSCMALLLFHLFQLRSCQNAQTASTDMTYPKEDACTLSVQCVHMNSAVAATTHSLRPMPVR